MTKRSDVRSSSNADFHTVSLSSAIDLFYSGVDPAVLIHGVWLLHAIY